MNRKLQTLSRADTDTLSHGVCPACNKNLFLFGGHFYHERGTFRKLLCLHCLREFAVSPTTFDPATRESEHIPCAIILHYVTPNHLLAQTYKIHIGFLPAAPSLPGGPTGSVLPSVKAPVLP